MNKKNISLILVGILLLTVQFDIQIGGATVDIFSDIIAFILIIAGILPLANRNVTFKKARIAAFIGLVLTCLGQYITAAPSLRTASNATMIAVGLSTVITIYFSYYFTESLILESVFQEKAAATRSCRLVWMIFGLLTFLKFIAVMSNISMISILAQAITAIFAIYYCSYVLSACSQLYMEGLPTKHMEEDKIKE